MQLSESELIERFDLAASTVNHIPRTAPPEQTGRVFLIPRFSLVDVNGFAGADQPGNGSFSAGDTDPFVPAAECRRPARKRRKSVGLRPDRAVIHQESRCFQRDAVFRARRSQRFSAWGDNSYGRAE